MQFKKQIRILRFSMSAGLYSCIDTKDCRDCQQIRRNYKSLSALIRDNPRCLAHEILEKGEES